MNQKSDSRENLSSFLQSACPKYAILTPSWLVSLALFTFKRHLPVTKADVLYQDGADEMRKATCARTSIIKNNKSVFKVNESDVKPGICVTVNTHSYCIDILKIYHLILNQICNIWWKYTEILKSMARLYIYKHFGAMRQIPGLTLILLTLTAKKSTKIHFSNDKIYIYILQFLSQGSKYYKYVKSPTMI